MNDDADDAREATASKREAAASFGAAASDYHESRAHGEGADLETLGGWCAGADRALDVATGGGHTAGAVRRAGVPDVVATDAAPEMVATAVDAFDVRGVVADAERLPFASNSFDAVACRLATHHFPDPESFLAEVERVLAPGGVFAFEDNVAPADPVLADHVNRFERLRDPTHGTLRSREWWVDHLEAAGLAVREHEVLPRRLDFGDWCARADVSPNDRETLAAMLRDPPEGGEAFYDVGTSDGYVDSFLVHSGLFRAQG